MNKITIGVVGPMSSGKGTFCNLLQNLDFEVFSISNKIREEATLRGIPHTRENLQNLGDLLREQFGPQIWAERIAFDIIGCSRHICIDSIRNPGEIDYLRRFSNGSIKIVGIDAPVEKRIAWYIERAKKRGEDNPDMTAFVQSSLRDRGIGQSSNGQQVDACLALSDVRFWNSGTPEDLNQELKKYLKTEFQFDPETHLRGKEK